MGSGKAVNKMCLLKVLILVPFLLNRLPIASFLVRLTRKLILRRFRKLIWKWKIGSMGMARGMARRMARESSLNVRMAIWIWSKIIIKRNKKKVVSRNSWIISGRSIIETLNHTHPIRTTIPQTNQSFLTISTTITQ